MSWVEFLPEAQDGADYRVRDVGGSNQGDLGRQIGMDQYSEERTEMCLCQGPGIADDGS